MSVVADFGLAVLPFLGRVDPQLALSCHEYVVAVGVEGDCIHEVVVVGGPPSNLSLRELLSHIKKLDAVGRRRGAGEQVAPV